MVDGTTVDRWQKEDIPNPDALFLRVHVSQLGNGELHTGVFREQGNDGMSTDWEKYSTPEEARQRATEPDKNGIVELKAGIVRSINSLRVEHDPDHERLNRAHALVIGMSSPTEGTNPNIHKTIIRSELHGYFHEWCIIPPALGEA